MIVPDGVSPDAMRSIPDVDERGVIETLRRMMHLDLTRGRHTLSSWLDVTAPHRTIT